MNNLFGIHLYEYQEKMSNKIIYNTYMRNGAVDNFEVSRQSGKSVGFVLTEVYLSSHNDIIYSEPIHVGFFAPRSEQVKTSFDKLKDWLPVAAEKFSMEFKESNSTTLVLSRPVFQGGRVTRYEKVSTYYALTLGETSHVESKTLHRAYVDEAQDIDDFKVNKEVVPMLASTAGNLYRIGVAGYRKCDFYKAVQNGQAIVCPVDQVLRDREAAFEITGDEKHLLYAKFIQSELERVGGWGTDYMQTQFKLNWIVEKGNMITRTDLEKCKKKVLCVGEPHIRIGVDLAKKSDRTVITAITSLGQRLKSKELVKMRYEEQYDEIISFAEWFSERGWVIDWFILDTTGSTADATAEALERRLKEKRSSWKVRYFYFAPQNKHNLYTQFLAGIDMTHSLQEGKIADEGQKRFEYWAGDPNVERFEQEMTDMEKEYKGTEGNLLACHHPNTPGAKDDHPDSTAMGYYEDDSVVVESPLSFEVI